MQKELDPPCTIRSPHPFQASDTKIQLARLSQNLHVANVNSLARTSRYRLPVGTGSNLLEQEASGVPHNPDTGTLFVLGDGGTSVIQVTKQGVYAPATHAGQAYGGTSAAGSAIWDGLSTAAPTYRAAQVGVLGVLRRLGRARRPISGFCQGR